jgi:DNA-binding response OmpR family regulator
LLDLIMPDLSGFEVLCRLKTQETTRHIPVIMISALDELDSTVRCIAAGAEDYLPKPFNPVLLRARISACLEKKSGCSTSCATRRSVGSSEPESYRGGAICFGMAQFLTR